MAVDRTERVRPQVMWRSQWQKSRFFLTQKKPLRGEKNCIRQREHTGSIPSSGAWENHVARQCRVSRATLPKGKGGDYMNNDAIYVVKLITAAINLVISVVALIEALTRNHD